MTLRPAVVLALALALAACGTTPPGQPLPDGGAVLPDGGPTACDAVAAIDGMVLHVNPVQGDDAQATGSASQGGAPAPACAFRTVTAALDAATRAARAQMVVQVDVASTVGPGETFPLTLPAGTRLAAAPDAGVTVQVAAGVAVRLPLAGASVAGLTLDGQGTAAQGVLAEAAGQALVGVEVKRFTGEGVKAWKSAVLTVSGASRLHDNGTGLLATDSAAVTVEASAASLATPLAITANAGSGVEVRGAARADLTGTRSGLDPAAGTLLVTGNGTAGVWVQQLLVAEGTTGPTGMHLTGVVLSGNGASGLRAFGGSGVTVRDSYLSHNGQHGLHVQTEPGFVPGGSGANTGNELTRLDLGSGASAGRNVLQDASSPNTLKGVCLELSSGGSTGGLLQLRGNVFATGGSSVDCGSIAASLPATGDCASAGPLGDVGRNPKNDFDLGLCTVP